QRITDLAWQLGVQRPTLVLGSWSLLWTLRSTGQPHTTQWPLWAVNLEPIANPVENLCTYCKSNPLLKAEPFPDGLPTFFGELMFARGTRPIVESVVVAHDAPVYSFEGAAVPASFDYAARATI